MTCNAAATTSPPGKQWTISSNEKGEFVRKDSSFRSTIREDGEFPPEGNRYHLYVSHACPWAHRTVLVRKLKGLEDIIGLSVVHYLMGGEGWVFASEEQVPGCIPDSVNNFKLLRQVYELAEPGYSGRITVPVLFDKKTRKIVNNESSEIIRIFNTAFNGLCKSPDLDLYPKELAPQIDALNSWVYDGLNNGVYKAGFAQSQAAHSTNSRLVYETLLRVEQVLKANEYLVGGRLTEADIRLFTTTIRFDPVYVGHFKCNLITLRELPALSAWMKKILEINGVRETVNMEHIKKHYYMSHLQLNPTQIVPLSNGPYFDADK